MAPKRKRSGISPAKVSETPIPLPSSAGAAMPPPAPKRRASSRSVSKAATNPELNSQVLDGPNAARASPDNVADSSIAPNMGDKSERSESPLSEPPEDVQPPKKQKKAKKANVAVEVPQAAPVTPAKKPASKTASMDAMGDPEADEDVEADEQEIKEASLRPPPVNSDYLPLPWKGRLGYACLNTYLRQAHPPVFSSRTCRIASILEHRHPLQDPSQPEHPTKNRPDKEKPADHALGQKWVESLGLANARDIIKMIRWNDKYNIKFMRLSSEMFPFASHDEYGYKLAPFASETLAEVGKVIAELGHRVTTHPGQFTQLGSPRKVVVENAIRDLEYHDEMLSLLKLPEQQNRDAVMILHMGGVFGSKPETIARFKENYPRLSDSIKRRLVLENDDMGWSVHDLLPVCQELNIPMVLDYHHHNIIFDKEQIREGTKDIMDLYPIIKETWTRKGITQKMHYSEPCPGAITGQQRRKHSPRVATLPPCANDMDLMIEAKDKEQAVFELMKIFKLPGHEKLADIVPYVRMDDNRALEKARPKKKTPKKKKVKTEDEEDEGLDTVEEEIKPIPDDEIAMGGPDGRVYWPQGMEEWLRPKKREVKKKDPNEAPKTKTPKKSGAKAIEDSESIVQQEALAQIKEETDIMIQQKKVKASKPVPKKKAEKVFVPTPTPSTSDGDEVDTDMLDPDEDVDSKPLRRVKSEPQRKSRRASGKVSYQEMEVSE